MRLLRAHAPVVAALALGLAGAPARAETTACQVVDALPATLEIPGRYCLASDLAVAGVDARGLAITAVNVTLDCNDHRVSASTAGNTAEGVLIAGPAVNATVRNCRIDGFSYGIASQYFESSTPSGARLTGNRISRAGQAGIFLYGSGHVVEDNTISDGQRLTSGYPTGIYLLGGYPGDYASANIVRGNLVEDFHPSSPVDGSYNLSIGISLNYQRAAIVEDNTILGLRARTGGGTYGIVSANSRELEIRDNRVLSAPPAAAPFDGGNWAGIFLQGTAEELETNHCAQNLVGHFNGNYNGCASTGNTGF
jgi:parallel beta-helix repeat protein